MNYLKFMLFPATVGIKYYSANMTGYQRVYLPVIGEYSHLPDIEQYNWSSDSITGYQSITCYPMYRLITEYLHVGP